MSIIEQAKSWFRGDGVPQPIAGLMQPLDVEHIAADMRLEMRGRQNGEREVPDTERQTHDPVEEEIVGRILADWNLQREHMITMLRAYRDRLAELNAASEIAQLRLSARSAVTKFRQKKQEARGELAQLGADYVEARDELAAFRLKHRLKRPARNPAGRWTSIGLLAVLVIIESAMNGLFFAKGSQQGLIGGIGTAFGISLVNLVGCFLLGLWPARGINWRGWFVRSFSIFVTVIGILAVLLLHLFAGHLRDATARLSEAQAFDVAAAEMLSAPWRLHDISSWYLFGLGVLFGLASFWKGYRHDDPYPGYGDLYRRERHAAKQYSSEHDDFFEELEGVRDETIEKFEAGISNIPEYVAKSHQVRSARSALIEKFRSYEQLIEQAANHLLAIYRDGNRSRRKTPAPEHFAHQWALPGSALSGPDVLALSTDAVDSVVTNIDSTMEELRNLSEEVLGSYAELHATVEHPKDMK